MTRIRRGLLLLALTAAVILAGSTGSAFASFADTSSISLGTISTASVAAPTSIVGRVTCSSPNATMQVTWVQSTSIRVSGYRVSVHYSDGFVQTADVASSATSWSVSTSLFNVTAYSVRYSVTTLTDYGWTTESALTGSFQC
jgi:hypothetical protein